MAKLTYIGLGVMGFPMAGHLVTKGGHEVTVYNRTPAKAQAWVARFGGKTMVQDRFDFGFAVDWVRKEPRIDMETASEFGADLTVTSMIDSFYAEIQKMGGGRWDMSSPIRRLRK